MKRVFKKNQIIITTLAIMIAVAGYLNYSGKILEDKAHTVSTDDNAELVTDSLQNTQGTYEGEYSDILTLEDDGTETAASGNTTSSEAGIGEAVLASSGAADSILASAKLNREQVRAKSKEELQEIINTENIGEEQKQNAIDVMTRLSEKAELEAEAELLLEAKGFAGCVVSISDESADIVVNETQLTDGQRAQIEDIVKRKTGLPGESIVISPAAEP